MTSSSLTLNFREDPSLLCLVDTCALPGDGDSHLTKKRYQNVSFYSKVIRELVYMHPVPNPSPQPGFLHRRSLGVAPPRMHLSLQLLLWALSQ